MKVNYAYRDLREELGMHHPSLLDQLSQHVTYNMPSDVWVNRRFSSYLDNITLTRQFKQIAQGQYQVGSVTYDAVLNFESFPYQEFDPITIFCLVNVWMEELPDLPEYRIEDDPQVDIELIDHSLADITVSVTITEYIYLVEHDRFRDVTFKAHRYAIYKPTIWHSPETITVEAHHGDNA